VGAETRPNSPNPQRIDTKVNPVTIPSTAPLDIETIDQFADRWSLSRASVYRLLNDGLPSIKVGRSRRLLSAAADAWLLERSAA
jgi:excisionase family DNA binding protein